MPALAKGGFVDSRPGGTTAVIGEGANPEAVLPLTPEIFANLGTGIVDAIQSLPTPETTIVDTRSVEEPIMIKNVVNIGTETIYESITEAITNREILVDSKAIVET